MIVTVTANPSLDRTLTLSEPLARGGVHRLAAVTVEAGGKGVNVARAIHQAGRPVLALLPAARRDPIMRILDEFRLPASTITLDVPVRTNITLTEPDGTTTKLNESGAELSSAQLEAFTALVLGAAADATWVVLSGSLPPGVPTDWYATLVPQLRAAGTKVAVDTSDAPLAALAAAFPQAAPDLLKPNGEELAQLSGLCVTDLETNDPAAAVAAARVLTEKGVGAVLATLGAAGAVLVTAEGAWAASPPPVTVRSTVGAGDSSVAGYAMADTDHLDAPARLAQAVAYGSAAASLAGSALPRPDQLNLNVSVRAL